MGRQTGGLMENSWEEGGAVEVGESKSRLGSTRALDFRVDSLSSVQDGGSGMPPNI